MFNINCHGELAESIHVFYFFCCPHQSIQHLLFNIRFSFSNLEFRIFKSNIQHSIPMHRDNICYPTSKFHFRISIFEFRIFKSNIQSRCIGTTFVIQHPNLIFEFRYLNFAFRISFCPWLVSSPIHSTFVI